MNTKGGILGVLAALVVAEAVILGIQIPVWGNNAPDWYGVVAAILGLAAGFGGWWLGEAKIGARRARW